MRDSPQANGEEHADIQASLRGDDMAYARIVQRNEADIARQMWRFTHDPGEHEALVHDVFVAAYFSLPSYRAHAPFRHWLRRLATHVGYAFWRNQARQRKIVPLDVAAPLAAKNATTGDGSMPTLFDLLARLRPESRLVLTLMYFDGLNAKEIAERMGWTHVMTRMLLSRARAQLRNLAERAGLGRSET